MNVKKYQNRSLQNLSKSNVYYQIQYASAVFEKVLKSFSSPWDGNKRSLGKIVSIISFYDILILNLNQNVIE
jgi:hypothetical protein